MLKLRSQSELKIQQILGYYYIDISETKGAKNAFDIILQFTLKYHTENLNQKQCIYIMLLFETVLLISIKCYLCKLKKIYIR